MKLSLRLTSEHHVLLKSHLYPGDGHEAVALALCGRRAGQRRRCLLVHKVIPISYDKCSVRNADRVTWPTELVLPLLEEANRRSMAILKIHSHPGGLDRFSRYDDESDRDFFSCVYGWLDDEQHHASAIMLPGGGIMARTISPCGDFMPLSDVMIVGDDIRISHGVQAYRTVPEFARRHAQAFGEGTTALLGRLAFAVIGCSGTGSLVVEQLARLGVGRLVLVDPDYVEEKNLNRVLNSTMSDAREKKLKVDVALGAIAGLGLGTEVLTFAHDLSESKAVEAVAECDVVFGCMDRVDGRHLLNRLCTFYLLPYFDVGVKLVADGAGGIEQICGTVHYLQPGRSSLLSRGVYTLEQVRASGLKRADPLAYAEQVQGKYIVGIQEDRPAVISVNMLFASLAINELLARLQSYRDDGNEEFATYRVSLTQAQIYNEKEGAPCHLLARHVGRGDVRPLLEMPELSEAMQEMEQNA
jgi:hypothetical protein